MKVSVIIPVLNEADRIRGLLDRLSADPYAEIIVVDGGSTDGTQAQITAGSRGREIRLLSAPRGRARQMNAGAAAATSDVLLFLHADTVPPSGTPCLIAGALSDPDVIAGAFRIRTICDRNSSWAASLLPLADLRSRYSHLPYGDQGIFVRKEIFEELGGFPQQPLMEDLELSRRLRRRGKIVILPQVIEVSGRRFLSRPVYYTLAVNLFPLLYRLGVRPETLGRWYGNPR